MRGKYVRIGHHSWKPKWIAQLENGQTNIWYQCEFCGKVTDEKGRYHKEFRMPRCLGKRSRDDLKAVKINGQSGLHLVIDEDEKVFQ